MEEPRHLLERMPLLSGPSRTIGPEVPLFDPASACQLRMELTLLLLVLGRCPPHLMTSPFLAEMLAARIPDPGAEMMSCGLLTSSKEPVPLHHSSVSVLIRGFVADVGCQLLHRNEEPGPVEAVFKCPVDAEALSMPSRPGCGGPASRPSSRRRDRAQELHGDALAGGQSSFLLQQEEAGGDMFSCSLGNLSPGEEAMLTLSYTYELLLEHDGAARYVLPTVLHPRYTPHATHPTGGMGRTSPQEVPRVLHGELPYTLSLSAMLQSPHSIHCSPTAPSAPLAIQPGTTTAQVSLAQAPPWDRDLELLVYYAEPHKPSVVLEARLPGAEPGDPGPAVEEFAPGLLFQHLWLWV
ncbi:unnamed protein product [Lepidochelys olivacea]